MEIKLKALCDGGWIRIEVKGVGSGVAVSSHVETVGGLIVLLQELIRQVRCAHERDRAAGRQKGEPR